MRKPHILKGNKTCSFPREVFFFDTETDMKREAPGEISHYFKIATACYIVLLENREIYTEQWKDCHSQEELFDFLVSKVRRNTCLYVFSANLWFDIRVSGIYEKLIEGGWDVRSFYNKDLTLIISLRKGKSSIKMLNVQNFFPMCVKKIGEIVGLEKLEVNFDSVSEDKLFTYCRRDTEIIKQAMLYWLQFVRKENLGSFGRTAPAQAFNAYRHRFMSKRIHIHSEKEVIALEREAYFGGRVECFVIKRLLSQDYYLLDVNSMYPCVMKGYEYPLRLIGWKKDPEIKDVQKLLQRYAIIAKVMVRTDTPCFPKRLSGKLIFPTGVFETTICTNLLKYGLDKGYISEIKVIAVYAKCYLFKKYVDFFYNLKLLYKEKGDNPRYILVKLFLNSLYGKFAQYSDKVIMEERLEKPCYFRYPYCDMETEENYIIFAYGSGVKIYKENAEEAFNSFPAIAAHVTENARNLLWKYITIAGRENCYYCDTDSVIVNKKGYENLLPYISDSEIGKLKVERIAKEVEIRGLKDYTFGDKEVIKGITKGAKRLFKNKYIIDVFPSPWSDLAEGIKGVYKTYKMVKFLYRRYDKGVVLDTGEVVPYALGWVF